MDLSYLKKNYELIIDNGLYFYDDISNCCFPINEINKELFLQIKDLLLEFKNTYKDQKFYKKMCDKIEKRCYDDLKIGPFWHIMMDMNGNKCQEMVRIIIDNAQIFTDKKFSKIYEIMKPENNISFKKYKKNKRFNKSLKAN